MINLDRDQLQGVHEPADQNGSFIILARLGIVAQAKARDKRSGGRIGGGLAGSLAEPALRHVGDPAHRLGAEIGQLVPQDQSATALAGLSVLVS